MSGPVVRVEHVHLVAAKERVLDDVNLTLQAGDVLGVVGPASSGKTALLRVIATLETASAGRVEVCTHDATQARDKARACLGYVASTPAAYPRLSPQEYLEVFARIAGNRDPQAALLGLEVVQLSAQARRPIYSLSPGEQQRLQLARALLHDPQLLLFDETQPAVDRSARAAIYDVLRDVAALGKAVVVTSRSGQELAQVCSMLGTLHAGKLVLQRASLGPGSPTAQLDLFRGREPRTETQPHLPRLLKLRIWPLNDTRALAELLANERQVDAFELQDPVTVRHRGGDALVAELVRKLTANGFDVVGVEQAHYSAPPPTPQPLAVAPEDAPAGASDQPPKEPSNHV